MPPYKRLKDYLASLSSRYRLLYRNRLYRRKARGRVPPMSSKFNSRQNLQGTPKVCKKGPTTFPVGTFDFAKYPLQAARRSDKRTNRVNAFPGTGPAFRNDRRKSELPRDRSDLESVDQRIRSRRAAAARTRSTRQRTGQFRGAATRHSVRNRIVPL